MKKMLSRDEWPIHDDAGKWRDDEMEEED